MKKIRKISKNFFIKKGKQIFEKSGLWSGKETYRNLKKFFIKNKIKHCDDAIEIIKKAFSQYIDGNLNPEIYIETAFGQIYRNNFEQQILKYKFNHEHNEESID